MGAARRGEGAAAPTTWSVPSVASMRLLIEVTRTLLGKARDSFENVAVTSRGFSIRTSQKKKTSRQVVVKTQNPKSMYVYQ